MTILSLNKPESSITLNLNDSIQNASKSKLSPIDEYYESAKRILVYVSGINEITEQTQLQLQVLRLTAICELYFRSVLAELPQICPVSRQHSFGCQLSYGSLEYYNRNSIGWALQDHFLFSGKDSVSKNTLNMTGQNLRSSSLISALEQYEKICQLRHAIVHAAGRLWYNNCSVLEIFTKKPKRVSLSILTFQNLVSHTHNLIRSYNNELGNKIIESWFSRGILIGKWEKDKGIYRKFYKHFYSVEDAFSAIGLKKSYNLIAKIINEKKKSKKA